MGCCAAGHPVEDIGMEKHKGASNQIKGPGASGTSQDEAIDLAGINEGLKEKVGLGFSCKGLPNLDKKSKTDAYIILSQMKGGQKTRVGLTEVILDSLNPEFVTEIDVDYFFEQQQVFIVDLYDCDDGTSLYAVDKQDYIGSVEFKLGKVVASRNQELESPIVDRQGKNQGKLTILAQEKKEGFGKTQVSFNPKAVIPNCKQSCFLTLSRQQANGKFKIIFKTEGKVASNGNNLWNKIIINTDSLCEGSFDKPILVQIFQFIQSGNHKKLATGEITLGRMIDGVAELPLSNGVKLYIDDFKSEDRVSFLDYIFGGCEINVHVAIDFTLSNKSPQDPSSLHYLNPTTRTNQYTDAIASIVGILENYDFDRMFPTYGFGGKVPDCQQVSHCFALNGDIYNPECNQVMGVLNAYYQSLAKVQLYGGTEFNKILQLVNGFAGQQAAEMTFKQQYTVCLILTDGVINDLEKTIEEIIEGSVLPLSIIIVGLGDADFEQMELLDADNNPLKNYAGKYSARDIVQFVPFREFKNDPQRLAEEVLKEVPRQLTSYFQSRNIRPNPKKLADRQAILIQSKMQNQMKSMMRTANNFFEFRKNLMVNQAATQGYDIGQVQQFLNYHGICEENPYWLSMMQNQQYQNKMKF